VAFRDGASPTQRGDAAGTRKSDAFGKCPSSKPTPNPKQAQSKRRSGKDNPPTGQADIDAVGMALKSGLIEPEQALELLADCDCLQLISPKAESAA
jgi:hypothetical protein